MKRSNIRLFIYLLSLSCLMCLSCTEDKSYDFPGDSGKVYVRLQSSNLVNSIHNVTNSGISKNLLGIFGDAKVTFPIRLTMPAKGNVEAVLGIDNSLIEAYNQMHKRSYLALDEKSFVLNNNTITIQDGQTTSTDLVEISLNTESLQNLELGEYLVPVKILKVNGSMGISENWNTVYWVISVANNISNMPLADRTGWTILNCSSEEKPANEGGINGPANCVLDGRKDSYWQTKWFGGDEQPPHHITIDMGKACEMAGIQYVSRNHSQDWPKTMLVETSQNGVAWNTVATYSKLPQKANAEFRSLFNELIQARYFRLTITEMYGGRPYTALAEVNAFVK